MGRKITGTGGASGRSGGDRVTLARIAEELGVSAMTVSNAYNRPERLSEELRGRIFETAKRLGYHGPDPVGRSLRRQRTDVVGVLYSNSLSYAFDDPAAVSFLGGLSAVTEAEDLGLLLVPAASGSSEERAPRAAAQAAVDGFVVYSMSDEEPLLAAALDRRLPTVVVDQPLAEGVPFVGVDDEAAAQEAADHLLGLGHARFGVVSFGLSPDGREGLANLGRQESAAFRVSRSRLLGYRSALRVAGRPWTRVPVYECRSSTTELGYRAAGTLLSGEQRPTAVLCTSDRLALGVLAAARDLGVSVPDDLSVVGFDDTSPAANADPPLTTVRQDHREKGSLAGRMLVSRLREGEGPGSGWLPTELVVRGSTAPPR